MIKSSPDSVGSLIAQCRSEIAMHAFGDRSAGEGLGVDELMRRLDTELGLAPAGEGRAALPRWSPARSELATRPAYSLHELLQFDDEVFIDTAYRVLLHRLPDPAGRAHYLEALRKEELSRIGVLAALRWSAEGVSRGVHVDGLLLPYWLEKAQRWPVVGPVVGWFRGLARLHTIGRRIETLRQAQAREWQALGRAHNTLVAELVHRLDEARQEAERQATDLHKLDERIGVALQRLELLDTVHSHTALGLEALEERTRVLDQARESHDVRVLQVENAARVWVDALRTTTALQLDRLEQLHRAASSRIADLEPKLEALDAALQTQRDAHAAIVARQRAQDEARAAIEARQQAHAEMQAAIEVRQRVQAEALAAIEALRQSGEDAKTDAEARQRAFDPLYARFEQRFRGEEDEIRKRAEAYLPLVRQPGIGVADAPVVDVGCGRGEWLDVLRASGLHAFGIDTNHDFVAACRARGLAVTESDALAALAALPDASAGAITSMHLVEHLPFETMVEMIDQAHRVLKPGGVFILETPNPENVKVGTHWFYLDPTHRNPLPPSMLSWLVADRGFVDVEVRPQTEHRSFEAPELLPGEVAGALQLNEILAGYRAAPDYAVVAWRK